MFNEINIRIIIIVVVINSTHSVELHLYEKKTYKYYFLKSGIKCGIPSTVVTVSVLMRKMFKQRIEEKSKTYFQVWVLHQKNKKLKMSDIFHPTYSFEFINNCTQFKRESSYISSKNFH